MKVLILLTCLIALASAGWLPYIGGHHEEHHPIIHDGVPLDTPEVQHARAEHLAAIAEAKAHAGPEEEYHEEAHYEHIEPETHSFDEHHGSSGYSIQHISAHHGHAHDDHQEHTSVVHHPHTVPHHTHPAYETSHHEPIVDHDGKPLDTPEVEKAKALHFAEVHKALARLHEHGHAYHHSLRRRDLGDYALHLEHDHSHGYDLHQNHAPIYGHQDAHYHHEIPQIDHDGKPLDTAEVEHAKALHFHAHQEALARVAHAKQHAQPDFSYHY